MKKTMRKGSARGAFIWNALGSTMNAAMTVLLTIVTAQVLDADASGILSLAFGIAFIFSSIATFEVRVYQVTDRQNRFAFADYLGMRCLTGAVGVLCCAAYVWAMHDDVNKELIILFVCLFKICEAFSDVFQGLFQGRERMDIAGKTMFLHTLTATVAYAVVLFITRSAVAGAFSMLLVSLAMLLLFDFPHSRQYVPSVRLRLSRETVKGIARECGTLALSTLMMLYVANAEKLIIDQQIPAQQAVWTALFMPAAFINLFAQFAFKPMLTGLTDAWNSGERRAVLTTTLRMCSWIAILTAGTVVAGELLGLPMLEMLYTIPLQAFKAEFGIILLGGGFNALGTFLWHMLIVFRKQKSVLAGDAAAFSFALIIIPILVRNGSVTGAAVGYLLSMVIRAMVFVVIYLRSAAKKAREKETATPAGTLHQQEEEK